MSAPEGFGPIVCKNHPEREAVPPMALRWCVECLRAARESYADPHATVSLGHTYQRERAGGKRTPGGGTEIIYAQQEKWK